MYQQFTRKESSTVQAVVLLPFSLKTILLDPFSFRLSSLTE